MYRITQNNQAGTIHVTADYVSDIETLPTNVGSGSTCFVIEDSSVWMLGNDRQWHEI